MKLSTLFALLLAACAAPHTQSEFAPAASQADVRADGPVADANRLSSDVAWLADDAREGRRAGTEQGKAAGEWIAARLAALGLEPLGERRNGGGEKGFTQEFTVALDPRDGGHSVLRRSSWVQHRMATSTIDGAQRVAPLFCSEPGQVEAVPVWCGYGIENAERGWNDFAQSDLAGAIALIVRGTPPSPKSPADEDPAGAPANPHGAPVAPGASGGADTQIAGSSKGWGNAGSIFSKVMNAKRHGAAAVILLPGKADEPLLRFDAGHAARAGIPAIAVDAATAQILAPGYLDHLGEKPAEFRDFDRDRLSIVADVLRGNGPATNVLGLLPGKSHDRVIVVGAHYDHLGLGGTGSLAPDSGGKIHHGADDNASGTATVLEIARLAKAGPTPPCDVIFALWSGEEEGLLGSEWWAAHPTFPLAKIEANLNLDMVGRAGNGKLQVLGAGTSTDFASWMKDAGARSGLDLTVSVSGGAMGGSSDHQTFLKRKIPALHLFSGLHADYHKPSDTADKFEAGGAAKVAELGLDLVQRMASAEKLAFVEPKVDESSKDKIQGGFRAWFGSIPSYSYDGKGVLLDGTSAGSPAERAGFLKGDVLLQVGDVRIDTIYDFTYALQLYKPGDVVLARYQRDGKEQEVRVTLASRELQ